MRGGDDSKSCLVGPTKYIPPMQREIRRHARLPSFRIALSDLKLVWSRLELLFGGVPNTTIWIDVEFEYEKFIVGSVDELVSTCFPSHKSTNFTRHCHSSEHSLHLYTSLHAGVAPRLVVTSGSEVWAAGAREVVLTVINQNKVWHHWLSPNFLASLLLIGIALSVFSLAIVKAPNLPFIGARLSTTSNMS